MLSFDDFILIISYRDIPSSSMFNNALYRPVCRRLVIYSQVSAIRYSVARGVVELGQFVPICMQSIAYIREAI